MDPVVIDNFISDEFVSEIVDLLDPLLKETPRPGMRGALGYETSAKAAAVGYGADCVSGLEDTNKYQTVKNINQLFVDTKKAMEDHFGIEMDTVNCTYQELTTGAGNPMHSDSTKLDGSPWRDDGVEEELEFSALIYLNNYGEEFTGGEIEFPLQNVLVEPKAGQLIFFKGDVDHIHEVKTVTSGIRKNLVFFFARKGNVSSMHYFEDSDVERRN
jgi:predicted 2-oxoglutarate/Fe(II)-dependent dioxygenase YbiX